MSHTTHEAMREPSIRCGALAGLDALLARSGACWRQVCARAGADPGLLARPEARMPVRQYVEILELAAQASGDDAIGLRLGYAQLPSSLGLVGEASLHAPDIGAAIAYAGRFLSVHQEGASLELRTQGRQALIAYSICHGELLDYRQDAELSVAKMLHFARIFTGCREWTPEAVYFEHPEPRDTAEHRRVFGAPVYFAQPCNALVVPRELLAQRIGGADGGRFADLQRRAETRRAQCDGGSDLLADLRRRVQCALRAGHVSIDAIAASMNLSERTLQRRLGEFGVTFNEVVERTRYELSCRYLRHQHLSLTEIGYLLGYSELSAFSRAFRRWAGVSPIAFRREACA